MSSRPAGPPQRRPTIRRAEPDEATTLSDLALRSKGVWGYSAEFLEACRDELAVAPAEIERGRVWVATSDDTLLGFYSVEDLPDGGLELGHLFVEPAELGRGIGRSLVEHAVSVAAGLGAERLVIQGDPYATDFYLRCGARRIGERPSASIPDRSLPLFEIPTGRTDEDPDPTAIQSRR